MSESTALAITAATATSSLGRGLAAHAQALQAGRSGLRPACDLAPYAHAPGWLGAVDGLDTVAIPSAQADYDCRNNRLAWLGLQQDALRERIEACRSRVGADRIGRFRDCVHHRGEGQDSQAVLPHPSFEPGGCRCTVLDARDCAGGADAGSEPPTPLRCWVITVVSHPHYPPLGFDHDSEAVSIRCVLLPLS